MIKKKIIILILCCIIISCGKKGDPIYKESEKKATIQIMNVQNA